MTASIKRLDCLISNAFLIGSGKNHVLIDSGSDFAYGRLRRQLAREGVRPGDLKLVILTHAHPDHAGCAARLKRDFGAEIAVHAAEAEWVRTGSTQLYEPCGWFGHVLNHVTPRRFEKCPVDRALHGGEVIELGPETGALTILHTPGHTPGHVCVDHSSHELFTGDLVRGSVFRSGHIGGPFFVQDRKTLRESVTRVGARAPTRLHFGHGKPAPGTALAKLEI